MLNKYSCLEKLAARRKNEVIVTCMGTAKPWEKLSDTALDFASVDSGMSHAADLAHGLSIAQPDRRIITLNGDGSMLMCLGTLVTVAQRPCENYVLIIIENGTYEVTGNQQVPGSGFIDYEAIARGAGLKHVHTITEETDFDEKLSLVFEGKGPLIFIWKVAPGKEPVPLFKDT
ncbi:MAG: thiamine pyrophosphate-dependent enzyme, partial [Verrucomicrobia bacterium]|nr:thiamine pyrophosphate-dependent enzyme [Verrucomicrobiota bacterium]